MRYLVKAHSFKCLMFFEREKLMTMKNSLQAAFRAALQSNSDADLMPKCNNDLSKNTPRAKSSHAARRTNRIKNYPASGRHINPPADSDPLLTDGFRDPRICC